MYRGLCTYYVNTQDGVIVHGLFMEAMRWDDDIMAVVDSRPGEMNPVCDPTMTMFYNYYSLSSQPLPMMHMKPHRNHVANPSDYRSPLYKTQERAGVLSTTGTMKWTYHTFLHHNHDQEHFANNSKVVVCSCLYKWLGVGVTTNTWHCISLSPIKAVLQTNFEIVPMCSV